MFIIKNIFNKKINDNNLQKLFFDFLKETKLENNYDKVLTSHKNITSFMSNFKYNLLYYYLSKKIDIKTYLKNNKILKKYEKRYHNSCHLLFNYISKYTLNNQDIKYITYLKEKNNNYSIGNKFYDKLNIKVNIEAQTLTVNLNNISDILDSIKENDNKILVYNLLSKKVYYYENKIKKYFNKTIKYKNEDDNYFNNLLKNFKIDETFFKTLENNVYFKNTIKKYIKLKKKILKTDKLSSFMLFSYYYDKNFDFNLDELLKVFAIFGENYKKILTYKIKNNIFANPFNNKGLTINDIYGNSLILSKTSYKIEYLFTTTHEIGHIMYIHFSENKILTSKEILFSEIVALVNELFLNDYLTKSQKLSKIYFLDSVMKILLKGLIEYRILKYIYQEQNIEYFKIKNKYIKIINEIYDNNIIIEENNFDFIIDGFITNDYNNICYFVALIVSINIFLNLKKDKEYIKKYIKFLKYSSIYDLEKNFKILDIDLNSDILYENAIKFINNSMR